MLLLSGLGDEQDESTLNLEEMESGLHEAVSIYASSGGNLYIVEQGNNRFLKMNTAGQRLDSLGRLGSGDYRFDQPVDIDATNDLKIYVSDYQNKRIQVYDRRLQYLSTVQLPRRAGVTEFRPTALSVNRSGELFFFDEDRHRVYRIGGNGSYRGHFDTRSSADIRELTGIAALDDLYLADPAQQVVHRMTSNGIYLGFFESHGELKGISSHNRKIWVLSDNSVDVFSERGNLLHRFILEKPGDVHDLAVYRDHIYFIGYETLYAAERKPVN